MEQQIGAYFDGTSIWRLQNDKKKELYRIPYPTFPLWKKQPILPLISLILPWIFASQVDMIR